MPRASARANDEPRATCRSTSPPIMYRRWGVGAKVDERGRGAMDGQRAVWRVRDAPPHVEACRANVRQRQRP
eukprot:scaffold9353_cov31-Tisochrysis_lutea.AAC.7